MLRFLFVLAIVTAATCTLRVYGDDVDAFVKFNATNSVVYTHRTLVDQLIMLQPEQDAFFVNVTFVNSNVRALTSTGRVEFHACTFRAPTRFPFVFIADARAIQMIGNKMELMAPPGVYGPPEDSQYHIWPHFEAFGIIIKSTDRLEEFKFEHNEARHVDDDGDGKK